MSKPTTKQPTTKQPTAATDSYPGAIPTEEAPDAPPSAPTAPAPDALPGTSRVARVAPQSDPNTLEFAEVCSNLDSTIRAQRKAMVAYYVARGACVARGIDVKVLKASTRESRDSLRAAAMTALTATAYGAYDPASEPKPRLDIWLYLYRLAQLFPQVANLDRVSVAREIAALLTRIDPPKTWQAPEEWDLKPGLDPTEVGTLIDRAVSESWSLADTRSAIDTLYGASSDEAPKAIKADPVASAERTARRLSDQVRDGELDGPTLVDDLLADLGRYGWILTETHDTTGLSRHRLVKTGR